MKNKIKLTKLLKNLNTFLKTILKITFLIIKSEKNILKIINYFEIILFF
jgi:hypothetical protein